MYFEKHLSILTFVAVALQLGSAEFKYAVGSMPGKCPKNFTYITNLDLLKMQGPYYGHFGQTAGKEWGCDGDCWTAYAVRIADGELFISMCCQKDGAPYCGEDVGSFTLIFDETQPGRQKFKGVNGEIYGYHLAFDYGNYVVAFACDPDTGKIILFAYTYGTAIRPGFDNFARNIFMCNGIAEKYLVELRQNSCCKYTFGCDKYCSTEKGFLPKSTKV